MKKAASVAFVYLVIFMTLCTCGIEDYPYIYAIPQANRQQEMNSWATVYIPNDNSSNFYFTHLTVYYRIYVSDVNQDAPSKSNIGAINGTLYSHYTRVEPYIDNDSIGSASVGSLFNNMNYYSIALENADIDSVLNSSALDKTIIFDFNQAPGSRPALIIGSARYTLLRSSIGGGGNFTFRPNRYFVNSPELNSSVNINSNVNADVTDKAVAGTRHTYVSLYIVAAGLNISTYSQIFSTPTFVGILKLPDPS